MIFRGSAGIAELAARVDRDDPEESSHWRKFHAEFRFTGDRFEGLQGFGGAVTPYSGLRSLAHRLMQHRFRAMAHGFPSFRDLDRLAREITRSQGRAYDLDILRQTLTLAFLRHHVPKKLTPTTTVCVIGDGFASMTALLLGSGSAERVVLVNLTKTLLVDLWYLRLWMGSARFERDVRLVMNSDGLSEALAGDAEEIRPRVIAIEATHQDLVTDCVFDSAVNIVSMQEMNPASIASYFGSMRAVAARRELVFYCCNRIDKTHPDGTVVRFSEYPWRQDDIVVVDELCPWHQFYYAWRPPFFRPYDGPIQHRLAYLAGDQPAPPSSFSV